MLQSILRVNTKVPQFIRLKMFWTAIFDARHLLASSLLEAGAKPYGHEGILRVEARALSPGLSGQPQPNGKPSWRISLPVCPC